MSEPDVPPRRDNRASTLPIKQPISRRTALSVLGAGAVAHLAGCGRGASTPATQSASLDGVHYRTLVDIGQRIASREVSPVDLTERMLDRIGRIDPSLKSY